MSLKIWPQIHSTCELRCRSIRASLSFHPSEKYTQLDAAQPSTAPLLSWVPQCQTHLAAGSMVLWLSSFALLGPCILNEFWCCCIYGKERNINLYNAILIQFISQESFFCCCSLLVGLMQADILKVCWHIWSVVHESAANGLVDRDGNFPLNIW